ncbi:hypothetical protein CRG98_017863, partial [Punica granatum]
EVNHPGSLCGVKAYPDFQSVRLFFGAHVDLLCWLDRGKLMVLEATQTLLYLGHLTILGKPFPKVYGSGHSETNLLGDDVHGWQSGRRVVGVRRRVVKGAPDDVWRPEKEAGYRGNWNAPVELPIVCGEAVKVVALVGLDDLMAGGAKAESSLVLVLFDFNGAIDPLPVCSEAGAEDVIVVQ